MPIIVGPGLRQHLDDNKDDPIHGHNSGTVANQDGSSYSFESVWGTKGFYISSNATGEWKNVGPFGGAEQ